MQNKIKFILGFNYSYYKWDYATKIYMKFGTMYLNNPKTKFYISTNFSSKTKILTK